MGCDLGELMSELRSKNNAKIKVIDSDKLINAINEGSYDVNLSAVMALGAVMLDTKKQERCGECDAWNQYINYPKSAQPEIIRCKDCMYGEQDDDGWWYCRSFGCQVGNKDGSGFCADAERKGND